MRRPIIAGNWKMNKTIAGTKELVTDLIPLVADAQAEVVICVPYTNIAAAGELIKGTNIHLGAENVHWAESGAFTGEISADMLLELGVEYVIIGHSERRQYFGETDETVCKRTTTALNKGLKPIICVGETLDEKESGKTEEVVIRQTKGAFNGISKEDAVKCVIAYEPVWAIGTGKTATSTDANATIKVIRENVAELMSMPEIDGGLIGGASLKAVDFSQVVKY